jgi:hypothetical protein
LVDAGKHTKRGKKKENEAGHETEDNEVNGETSTSYANEDKLFQEEGIPF